MPWSDDPEEVELGTYISVLPCRVPETAIPAYYNASVTIADTFGAALPWKPHYELATPGSSSRDSLNTFWQGFHTYHGVHMMQVGLLLCFWSFLALHPILLPFQYHPCLAPSVPCPEQVLLETVMWSRQFRSQWMFSLVNPSAARASAVIT